MLKTLLKLLMEDFDPLEPKLRNLDFERPNKELQWRPDLKNAMTPADKVRSEYLSKQIKEAFLMKVFELRKVRAAVPKLSDVIKQSIEH